MYVHTIIITIIALELGNIRCQQVLDAFYNRGYYLGLPKLESFNFILISVALSNVVCAGMSESKDSSKLFDVF